MAFEVRIEHTRTMPVPGRLKTTPPSSSQYSTSSSESPIATPTFTVSLHYDGSSSDDGVVPKIEELNDSTDDGKASMEDEGETLSNGVEQKKPRGRPKKHHVEPPANANNQIKGRTKTGCITCRQRKKKCDETKPICTNYHFGRIALNLLTLHRLALSEEQLLLRISAKGALSEWEAKSYQG